MATKKITAEQLQRFIKKIIKEQMEEMPKKKLSQADLDVETDVEDQMYDAQPGEEVKELVKRSEQLIYDSIMAGPSDQRSSKHTFKEIKKLLIQAWQRGYDAGGDR